MQLHSRGGHFCRKRGESQRKHSRGHEWYKVALDGVSNFICVDPKDGVKVAGGDSAEETKEYAYDNTAHR